jgi:putative ABC transport system substrate-binding protein
MRRREFIMALGGAAAAWPLAARAQQSRMPTIGVLGGVAPELYTRYVDAFFRGLQDTGFTEGRNLNAEQRWARGELPRLPVLAGELIRLKPDVIVTLGGTSVAIAAKAVSTAIPIVFAVGSDPVEDGLVASLNRPGANITGITFFTNALVSKRLELLRELAPQATMIAVLVNPNNARADRDWRDVQAAASGIGQQLKLLHAASAAELDAGFAALLREKVGALLVASDAFLASRREQIAALAARHAIPAIYGPREFVAAGGLISYGADVPDAHRLVGLYAGRILKGEKPGDLPVMQPTKFELVINLKTARALSLDVPPTLLARADEIIE